jgi:phage tail sheath protein FI
MGDRFALLDGPPTHAADDGDDAIAEAVALAASLRSPWGAMYFPWVRAIPQWTRPLFATAFAGSAQWRCPGAAATALEGRHVLTLPASGLVSGQYALRDRTVGPQRAPGGALLIAAVDPTLTMTIRQCAALNSAGVNPLRFDRASAGVVVSGARTLQAAGALAYVSTVRVVAEFRRWLAFGLSDLVFEPNSPALRERVRVRLVARCEQMLQDGALAASGAQQAYFVQCDDEVNPPAEVDSGRVVAVVGLAPTVPAEFIEVRVIHDASGTISTEFA